MEFESPNQSVRFRLVSVGTRFTAGAVVNQGFRLLASEKGSIPLRSTMLSLAADGMAEN